MPGLGDHAGPTTVRLSDATDNGKAEANPGGALRRAPATVREFLKQTPLLLDGNPRPVVRDG